MAQSDQSRSSHDANVVVEENVAIVADGGQSRTSWGAIIAGAVCALAIYMSLGLIGIAAGIGAIDPAEEANPLAGVPTGVGLWWLGSSIAALFAGGLIAGRLAGWPADTTGALHGLTVGAIAIFLISYIALSTIGSALTGAAGAVANLFSDSKQQAVQVTLERPGLQSASRNDRNDAFARQANAFRQANGSGQANGSRQASDANRQQPVRRPGTSDAQWNFDLSSYLLYEVVSSIRDEASQVIDRAVDEGERRRASKSVKATFSDLIESPGDAGRDIQNLFELLLSNEGVLGEEDLRQAKQILVNRLDVDPDQADMILDRWQERYEQAIEELNTLVRDAQQQLANLTEASAEAVQDAAQEANEAIVKVASPEEQRQTVRAVERAVDRVVASPRNAAAELQNMLSRLFGKDGVWSEEDLAEVRTLLKEQTGLSENDIEQLVSRWQQRYKNAVAEVNQAYEVAEKEAVEAADAALDATAATAGWASLALVLGLGAAALGGLFGRPANGLMPADLLRRVRPYRVSVSGDNGSQPIGVDAEPLNHRKPWTDEEVAKLRELASENRDPAVIALKLQRTETAVIAKAQEEDIKVDEPR